MSDLPRTEFAQLLCRIRDLSGRSLRSLERDTGISSSSLSRYFAGQTVPPWDTVVALCRLVKRDPRPMRRLWEAASRAQPVPAKQKTKARNHLPFDVGDFTGREKELAEVLSLVKSSRAVAIDGMAGVGKTCLAVHAAHLLTEDFPDGQFYLDLFGFTAGREPLDPGSALQFLLSALEISNIPSGTQELSARLRAELSQRQVIVVLDNVANAEQARLLLPGAGASVVLITSRNRLMELEAIPPVSLEAMPETDAAQLFSRAAGDDRGERDPQALSQVLRLCGGLPLAIRVAAARLRHRPGWTVGILAERLGEGTSSLDTAFDMSLRQLEPLQRRVYRLLGLLPGAGFSHELVALLADISPAKARSILEDLVDAHLVQEPAPGRYKLHDLVREHARRVAQAEEHEASRASALQRMLGYYLSCAAAAHDAMPYVLRTGRVSRVPLAVPAFDGREAALAWYDLEHANLVAAFDYAVEAGADEFVSELPMLMRPYFFRRRAGTAEENRMLELAVKAAERLGDRLRLAELRDDLGYARYTAGRTDEAMAEYTAAAALISDVDDPELAGLLAMRRGYLQHDRGFVNNALALYRLAAAQYSAVGHQVGIAYALAYQGWASLLLGRFSEAAELAHAALEPPPGEKIWPPRVTALVTRGLALARSSPETADSLLREALGIAEEDGHLRNRAWCSNMLGVVLRHAGKLDEALHFHRQAFSILEELAEEQWEMDFSNSYAETCRVAGLRDEALARFGRALELARTMTYKREEALAHQGIAAILDLTDAHAAARHRDAEAAILHELGVPGVAL